MKIHRHFPVICLILLTLIATSCSKVADHNAFLKANGITETEKIPVDYASGNGWKPLTGPYVYYMDAFNINGSSQMIYLLADKKENKLLGIYHINPLIMPATYAQGVNPPTIVTNFEEISEADLDKSNDMTEFNKLMKAIPEMKDFSWKNEFQNTIASAIILKTHFIYAVSTKVNDKLFTYSETPVKQNHDEQLQEILNSEHSMFVRPVKRLNEQVEMSHFVSEMGFNVESNMKDPGLNGKANGYYINDLLKDDPINFKGSGKMFFFFPFKSYVRVQKKGETPIYGPAIATYEYSLKPDQEGFPVFIRHVHYVSLLLNDFVIN